MSDNDQKPDPKAVISSFNQLIRDQRNLRRVNWTPSSSPDPAERQRDRDALNAALRRAGGHGAEEEESPAGSFPWKSLADRDGDT
jgi:hypothetical protein